MDALCQREIDQLGMPRWYHSHLEAAKKIILVISKGYLKVRFTYHFFDHWITSRTDMILYDLFISQTFTKMYQWIKSTMLLSQNCSYRRENETSQARIIQGVIMEVSEMEKRI